MPATVPYPRIVVVNVENQEQVNRIIRKQMLEQKSNMHLGRNADPPQHKKGMALANRIIRNQMLDQKSYMGRNADPPRHKKGKALASSQPKRPELHLRRSRSLPDQLIPEEAGRSLFWFRPPASSIHCPHWEKKEQMQQNQGVELQECTNLPVFPDLDESSTYSAPPLQPSWLLKRKSYSGDDDNDDDENWTACLTDDEAEEWEDFSEELCGLSFLSADEEDC
jgi:hypothetical protein